MNTVIDCDAQYGKVKSGGMSETNRLFSITSTLLYPSLHSSITSITPLLNGHMTMPLTFCISFIGPPAETLTELIARHDEAIWSHFDKCSGWEPSPVGVDVDNTTVIGGYLIDNSDDLDDEDTKPKAINSRHAFDSDESSSDEDDDDDDIGDPEADYLPADLQYMEEDAREYSHEGEGNNGVNPSGPEDVTADAVALGIIDDEAPLAMKGARTAKPSEEHQDTVNAPGEEYMEDGDINDLRDSPNRPVTSRMTHETTIARGTIANNDAPHHAHSALDNPGRNEGRREAPGGAASRTADSSDVILID